MSNLEKFRELGLSDIMLDALQKKGFEEPTPIQALTIPFLLSGVKDVVGQAQTGTGKTGAFGIPLLENVKSGSKSVKALVMAPTRELAVQVTEELNSLSPNSSLRIISVYGGQPIDRQIDRLRRGVDIVVGTPGRIMDHLKRKTLDISQLDYVVLDEADEMLNMGFIEDIETILESTPEEKRMLLFSATMPRNILNLAKRYMRDYEVVATKKDDLAKANIQQIYFEVSQSDKFEALYRIIDVEEEFYGVVFCRTRVDTDDIASKLFNRGCRAAALHGDVSQGQREKILQKFKDKKLTVLVATDVAARGIDVDNLTHVINYSLPQDPESYVHRIGRTGRAGKEGTAITLITPSEYRKLLNIQRLSNANIEKQKIPGVKEVIETKTNRIKASLNKIIESENFTDFEKIAEDILKDCDSKVAFTALLKHAFKDELSTKSYNEIREGRGRDSFDRNSRGERRDYVDRKGTARLFVAKGKADGMDPLQMVDFIKKESGIALNNVDDIKVLDSFSFITAPFEDAEKILKTFQRNANNGRSVVSRAKERTSPSRGGQNNRSGGGYNRNRDNVGNTAISYKGPRKKW
jgi:ATP-dependent RNA helicase DeaD